MQISENTLAASKFFLSIEGGIFTFWLQKGLQSRQGVNSQNIRAKEAAIPLKDAPPALLPRYP